MSSFPPTWTAQPFRTLRLEDEMRAAARPFFERLPDDPYVPAGWRARRLTRWTLGPGATREALPATPVWQTKAHNSRFGDLPRSFAPLDAAWASSEPFDRLVASFRAALPEPVDGWVLWAHQIRTRWRPGGIAPPPDGPHRDERVYLAIAVFDVVGVDPGTTRLLAAPEGPALFERTLQPGDVLVFDDERLWHETRMPVQGGPGHRDVMLLAVTRQVHDGLPPEPRS